MSNKLSLEESTYVDSPEDECASNGLAEAKDAMKKVKEYNAKRNKAESVSKEFQTSAELVAAFHRVIFNNRSSKEMSNKLEILTKYAIDNQVFTTISNVCAELLESGDQSRYPGIRKESVKFVNTLLLYLMNSSHNHFAVSKIIAQETCFPTTATRKLRMWKALLVSSDMDPDIQVDERDILKWMCGILHNISMFEENIDNVRAVNCIDAMKPYLDSKDNTIRLLSLATIADLLNESEYDILHSKPDIIEFLMTTLETAMDVDGCNGWSLKEITRIVQRVARNDKNKDILVGKGAIPHLVSICERDNTDEQLEAVLAIWALSFDKQIRKKMKEQGDCNVIPSLQKLSKSSDERVKTNSENVLSSIEEQHYNADREDGHTHIMISYNWKNQSKVKQIRDSLNKNCITVWMDVDNMFGSIVEAIADGIQQADIVLMCYSRLYMNSYNCRTEAEYAFTKKKTIIPIKMEQGYNADGWLGVILGAKLYYDFSDQNTYQQKVNELIRAIQHQLNVKNGVEDLGTAPLRRVTRMSAANATEDKNNEVAILKTWTCDDVKNWLKKNCLLKNTPENELQLSRLENLRGHDIVFLKLLVHESPKDFYKIIQEKLELHELQAKANFRLALENISSDLRSQ